MPNFAARPLKKAAALLLCLIAAGLSMPSLVAFSTEARDSDPSRLSTYPWLAPTIVASHGGESPFPIIQADSTGQLHILWDHFASGAGSDIVAARGTGVSWTPTLTLTSGAWAFRPSLAAGDAGQVHAVWSQIFPGDVENIAYAIWNGATWSQAERVSSTADPGRDAAVTIDNSGQVHVAWVQQRDLNEAYILWSKKQGLSPWSSPVTVSVGLPASQAPRVAADSNGSVHLVWYATSGAAADVYYSRFDGSTWSTPDRKSAGGASVSWNPAIGVDAAGSVYLVWEEFNTARLVYRKGGTDGVWSASVQIPATADPRRPTLAVLGQDDLALAWENWSATTADEVYFSRGFGTDWSTPLNVSQSGSPTESPSLAIDPAGRIHLTWVEVLGPSASAIYFSGQRYLPYKVYLPAAMKWFEGN